MADDEVKPTWEVALVVGAGVIAAAIGVLMSLDRANGAVFTALGLGAALLSLATAVLTRALASQPRRHQLMIGGGPSLA